jgi:hypothetical protein
MKQYREVRTRDWRSRALSRAAEVIQQRDCVPKPYCAVVLQSPMIAMKRRPAAA